MIPVSADRGSHALLGDVATIGNATIVGEYDRINGQRMVTLTANVAGQDLGRTVGQVDQAIARAGTPPRGAAVAVRGQIGAMRETFTNITAGLVVAVVVIFLLLAANFQSLRLAFVVVSTVPAVLMGVVLMLAVTRTTLNVQSFMGAIMAIGVAVANAILLVTFAEQSRVHGTSPLQTAIDAARARMRPVLDDERRDDRRHDSDGARIGRGRGGDGAARSRRDWRPGRRHGGDVDRAAVGVFTGAAVGAGRIPVHGSRRSSECVSQAGSGMRMQTHLVASARRGRRALVARAGGVPRQCARPDHGEGRAGGTADRRSGQGRRTAAQRDVVAAGRVDALPDRRAVFASHGLREDDRAWIAVRASAQASSWPRSRRRNSSRRSPKRNPSCRAPRRNWRRSARKPRRPRAPTRS